MDRIKLGEVASSVQRIGDSLEMIEVQIGDAVYEGTPYDIALLSQKLSRIALEIAQEQARELQATMGQRPRVS